MMVKNNPILRKALLILIFILGFGIMIYPIISQKYYEIEANEQVTEFDKKKAQMPTKEVLDKIELAKAYNAVLDPSRLADPYNEKERKGIAAYAKMLEIREKIGHIEIPKLGQDLPIYAGTSEDVLQMGAGHLEGTSLPIGGKSTHTVITAHRGLPNAKLFRNLNEMKVGDEFYIHNIKEILAYEVDQILTVDPIDFEPVLVTEGEDYATLLTCTPYMINSHRLLVRGHRVPYVPLTEEEKVEQLTFMAKYGEYLIYLIPVALTAIVYVVASKKAKKKRLEESVDKGDLD